MKTCNITLSQCFQFIHISVGTSAVHNKVNAKSKDKGKVSPALN
jgi:hypothetical protein